MHIGTTMHFLFLLDVFTGLLDTALLSLNPTLIRNLEMSCFELRRAIAKSSEIKFVFYL